MSINKHRTFLRCFARRYQQSLNLSTLFTIERRSR